jgi:hypothetical protein
MSFQRIGCAMDNMTSNNRGIIAGSAFIWLYQAWHDGNSQRGIEPLPEVATIVEVGVGGTHSLGCLLDIAKDRPFWTIYAIDPYVGEGRFRGFIEDCAQYHPDIDRVRYLRYPSPQIARLFEPGTLDAVMIDGDHDHDPVVADIRAWWPRVKVGGYLAGDDVDPMFPGCELAWRECFEEVVCYGSTACVRKG